MVTHVSPLSGLTGIVLIVAVISFIAGLLFGIMLLPDNNTSTPEPYEQNQETEINQEAREAESDITCYEQPDLWRLNRWGV